MPTHHSVRAARRGSFTAAVVGIVAWSLLGVIALLLHEDAAGVGSVRAEIALAVLAAAMGVWAFLQHGGPQITAAGTWSFASAIFVGFSGLYWAAHYGAALPEGLLVVTAVCYFSHVLMYYGFWYRDGRIQIEPGRRLNDRFVVSGATVVGAMLTAGSVIAFERGLNPSFLGPAAYTGVTLTTISLLVWPAGPRLGVLKGFLVAAGFLLYARFIFTGYGRLNLATLGLMIAMATCYRVPGRWIKVVVAIAVGPVLYSFILIREAFGTSQGATLSGIGSVISPLWTLADVVTIVSTQGPSGGDTFLAAAVTQVPSSLWPGKPDGFGVVLAKILVPEQAAHGQSLAALSQGEWIYDFGWWGVPLMVLVIGGLIKLVDVWLRHAVAQPVHSRRHILSLTGAILAASGMADLMWVGTQTFSSRAGTRLLVLVVILMLWGLRRPLGASARGNRAGKPMASRIEAHHTFHRAPDSKMLANTTGISEARAGEADGAQ